MKSDRRTSIVFEATSALYASTSVCARRSSLLHISGISNRILPSTAPVPWDPPQRAD